VHADTILHRCLDSLLQSIHRARLATLFAAVAACVSGPALSLTDVGRRFGGAVGLRHKVKRADRLLGNRHLHREAKSVYHALCRVTLKRVREPLILIDWSDLKADQSLHLLRASLPVGGRSLTLYEEVHPQKKLNNGAVHARFLRHLSTLIPPGAAPIVIADAGFKVPFHREVERLGWRWVGRVRGRDFVRLKARSWTSCKRIFTRATATPTALGEGEWIRSNPLRAVFALVREVPKGRRGKTAFGTRSRAKADVQHARAAKEPWLLVASTRFADWPAKRLVRLYRQRMQIEQSFRDMKNLHFGEGLERSRSRGTARFTVLVLIASLAAFLLWLIGTAAVRVGLDRRLHPGTGKRRVYSRIFLARLLLVLDSARDVLDGLLTTLAPPDRWIASDHDALLADSAGGG
jgi:hypothetical protein